MRPPVIEAIVELISRTTVLVRTNIWFEIMNDMITIGMVSNIGPVRT